MAEHPSFGAVPPSSHCSFASTALSPQTAFRHGKPGVTQTQPVSSVQRMLQPSPEVLFPSSQASAPARRPSPHWAARQTEKEQSQPGSTAQVDEHPSPEAAL